MATLFTSATRMAGLLAVVVTSVSLSSCTPKPNGPTPAAQEFFFALAKGDTGGASALTDRPEDARAALNQAWKGLQASSLHAQVLGSKFAEDTGTVSYRYTWHLPKSRTWTYDGQLSMVRNEGRWEVRWTTTGLHPKLGEHQTFALRADPPRRASVNERSGSDVLVPGNLYHFALDARSAGAYLMTTATAVVDSLRPFDDTLDAQRLAEEASSSPGPLSLITLRQSDRDQVAAVLGERPGLVITPQAELLPTDETFAPAIIGEVKKAVVDDLDGQAGWRIVSVNQNGVDSDILNEVAPAPSPSVTISLDRAVQNAAQNAVDGIGGKKAMIVAIKPSTGEILAVAQNAAADVDGPAATTGLYPPGSTFKIITAGAAIERDMATPNTLLGCPGTVDIGHRTVPNYGGFDLGVVPMSRAFASSCNTTFAELASQMPPRGLTQAAAQYGIGADYNIEGISTVTGSVPPTVNLAERTEDGFGQGKVLVSPFGMAMAAATVAAGKTPVPQLIEGRQTAVTGDVSPITPKMLDGLRPMMQLVVTNGTAKDLNGMGDVRGKTGEAEFNGGSHSWFAGYRGDMAFAALIVGGGSSEYAVRMLRWMLEGLPPDYLA
ncbi:penicillin-binding transpeptidase domain-containing protein [Mycobacterium sp. ITM-2016-00318]|uniref:penicillin-binding transpeptidase domain-containing protein n=1 Tax=Mycobacterium sp. ITM-2016-00318 TaxID=2099693 RepID=UPI000CF8CC97|nr:penicillin-binding transpeptidase domain-containing protein [Mycobacterium sp. ITM-2016-00318]WNG94800.1 penicillin-binding transpeptidase domain-containing protein [Mycobacterium sp. ITM-2016-00318]